MILLDSLTLENFMCIPTAHFEFAKDNITIYFGENGAGKSSVFEAISLCWTERRRGDSFKDFIMHGHESAKIHHSATIRGEAITFDIEIVNKRGVSPFQRTITYKKQTYTNSECATLLSSLDIDFLQHIMFSMQGDSNITDLKPAERTKLLKRIFNFEFEPQLAQIEKLIEQDNQSLIELKVRQDVYSRNTFKYYEEEIPLTPVALQTIQQRILEIDALIRDQEQRQTQQLEVVRQLGSYRSQYAAAQTKKHSTELDIENLISNKDKLLVDEKSHKQTLANLPEADYFENLIKEKTEAIEALTQLISTNKALIKEKEILLTERRSNILELKNHIEAHKSGKCPKCGQATKPEVVPTLEEKLENLSHEYTELIEQKSKLEVAEKTAERTTAAYQTEIPNLQEKISSVVTTKLQFERILKTLEESISQTEKNIQFRRDSLAELIKQLQELEIQIEALSPTVGNIFTATTALSKEKEDLSKKITDNLAVVARNTVIRQANEKTSKQEEENKKVLEDLNRQENDILVSLSNYKEAKKILEVDLPNYIIVKACSKIEKHVNSFIAAIKPGMIVRLFQARSGVEFFYSPTGVVAKPEDWTSTKMASGFERELLSAAWRVALARAYNLSILMMDEADSSASAKASGRMFKEIANLQGFSQLFIITHKPEVVSTISQENDKVTAYLVHNGTFLRQEY